MAVLKENNYGKARVRLAKVIRNGGDHHQYINMTVETKLWGDLSAAYTAGDNSGVLPTDTQKNSVYALAASHPLETIESFAVDLATRFLDTAPHLTQAEVLIEQEVFHRLKIDGQFHPHAFKGGDGERRTVQVVKDRESCRIVPGFKNLILLKTTNSAFVGFFKDEWTVLPEESDRIMGTSVTAEWRLNDRPVDFNRDRQQIREMVIEVFATHNSQSVQHTLYEMGNAVLAKVESVEEIKFSMPNIHNIPFDLSRIGLENKNEIFVPIDEPHGTIEGTIARG